MAASEIRFEALGQTWRFKFGFGALCRLEQAFDLPFARIIERVMPEAVAAGVDPEELRERMLDVRLSDVRVILRAGIEDGNLTDQQVEDIIDDLGLADAALIIREAMLQDLSGGSETSDKNPPKSRKR